MFLKCRLSPPRQKLLHRFYRAFIVTQKSIHLITFLFSFELNDTMGALLTTSYLFIFTCVRLRCGLRIRVTSSSETFVPHSAHNQQKNVQKPKRSLGSNKDSRASRPRHGTHSYGDFHLLWRKRITLVGASKASRSFGLKL